MKNNIRKPHTKRLINPWIIIGLTAFIVFWLCVLAYNNYQVTQAQKAEIYKVQQNNQTLQKKLDAIKAKKNPITSGKFNLQEHYEELNKIYSTLLKYDLVTARSIKDLSKYSDLYNQYLGNEGFSRLKKISFINSKSISSNVLNSKVTFRNFDANALTTEVNAFTLIQSKDGKAVVYMTCVYDFKDKSADSAEFKINYLND